MYKPSPFNIDDRNELIAFCKRISFGSIISSCENKAPIITHVPFVLKELNDKLILEFHLALANPHVEVLKNGIQTGVSVMGEHGYISSSVYQHINVPTYNYEAVYLAGKSSEIKDFQFLNHLNELVDHFEKDRKSPIDFNSFPERMMSAYLKEIIGIRIEIESMEGAFKLSQNRNTKDFSAILSDLEEQDQLKLASEMKKHYPKL